MKIVVLDISSRNPVLYNPCLCNHLGEIDSQENTVYLLSITDYGNRHFYKHFKLLRLLPEKYDGSSSLVKKAVRAIEVLVNYIIVFFFILFKQPDVLHIQWLPLVDICSIEFYFLLLFKSISKVNIILTMHNIYPHRLPINKRQKYKKRFLKVASKIDGFMVHLLSAKKEFTSEYGIPEEIVYVAYHGIFTPNEYTPSTQKNERFTMVMYGYQNRYKGTDILLEALKLLPFDVLQQTETYILGKTENGLYEKYENDLDRLHIKWINKYVSDDLLYNTIGKADLILLPYRKISQSGVLLLAISYLKPILTSDLPSFKETLEGYDSSMFFESENPFSLANKIGQYVEGSFDVSQILKVLKALNVKYSWRSTAIATMEAYKATSLIKCKSGIYEFKN